MCLVGLLTEHELKEHGVNVVIYANHLNQKCISAMVNTANMILKNERCSEANEMCMSIKEILNLIPGGR